MTRVKLMELISRAIKKDIITDIDLYSYRTTVKCEGKICIVYLVGNDEMFTPDGEFYQIGIDPVNDRIYKFFFKIQDEFDDIDYTEAYRMEEIEGTLKILKRIAWKKSKEH